MTLPNGLDVSIKVCGMRDDAYKALLDHTAKDPSPMQARTTILRLPP